MRELRGDQPKAYEAISEFLKQQGGGIFVLAGHAGTGKTFLMREVQEMAKHKGLKAIFTAPTNKAVKVLKKNLPDDFRDLATTHSAMAMKEHIDDEGVLTFKQDGLKEPKAASYHIIIVDEASMIDDSLFWPLLDMSEQGKKIIYVGDIYQIPPVNYENALPFDPSTQREHNIQSYTMTEIIRQAVGSPIIEHASRIREGIRDRKIQFDLDRTNQSNEIGSITFLTKDLVDDYFVEHILPKYKSEEYNEDTDFIKIIAWTNETVRRYNKKVRQFVYGSDKLPGLLVGEKLITDAPVFEGDTITIPTNSELLVLGLETETEMLSDEYMMTCYKAHVRSYDSFSHSEHILKIVHEDSIKVYNELLNMQARVAKAFPKGSYAAKSAWRDYYNFIKAYHQVKYSYSITAHKSQGSTYNTAFVAESDILKSSKVYERNRILYTACTRASKDLIVVY